jgi:lipopolysaccharide transport system ATP-binding protein
VRRGTVTVSGLGKRYQIGRERPTYGSLRDSLGALAGAPLRRLRNPGSSTGHVDAMWALRDITFAVEPGDVVGVIGRNGAGKSTLLRILSRITTPTTGKAALYGRIGSLLEVGTGFHPELTGRENIFLNGAILGMPRAEVRRQFDAIVEFAEIGRYLDTPVKRYSSGMYVRLAFAVAAHLDPDILAIDEVLAVGDYAFQKKCLGKVGDVARNGRTVLFVSHNMGTVSALCRRGILLDAGRIIDDGPINDVVATYIAAGAVQAGETVWPDIDVAPGSEDARIRAVRIVSNGRTTADVDIADDVQVEVEFWNLKEGATPATAIQLIDRVGVGVLSSATWPSAIVAHDGWYGRPHPVGLFRSACVVPGELLNEGYFSLNVYILAHPSKRVAAAEDAVSFTVHDSGAMRGEYTGPWLGVIRPRLEWKTELVDQISSPDATGAESR